MNARPQDIADAGLMGAEDAAAHARFVSLAGQDSRTARLMTQCAELRAELAEARQALADATSLTFSYAKLIGQQHEDLRTLKGENATPQSGCEFFSACVGDATVLCEYEYTAAEAPIFDADHPGVGPGHDAELSLIQVFINGRWCDPTDFMSDVQINRIEEQIWESRAGDDDEGERQDTLRTERKDGVR